VAAALTDRRVIVRVTSPAIAVNARRLVSDYRSPISGHGGRTGRDYPEMFAGFVVTNSETGHGAFTITPRVVFQVCGNGQTRTQDAKRKVHLGARMDEGTVNWSADTQAKAVALIQAQTRDAVSAFMSEEYLTKAMTEMADEWGVEIPKPEAAIKHVAKACQFSDAQAEGILAAFIKGGTPTVGGIVQAVTATAQDVVDGDAAYDMEAKAGQILSMVPALVRAR
jgi:hypothetical protein